VPGARPFAKIHVAQSSSWPLVRMSYTEMREQYVPWFRTCERISSSEGGEFCPARASPSFVCIYFGRVRSFLARPLPCALPEGIGHAPLIQRAPAKRERCRRSTMSAGLRRIRQEACAVMQTCADERERRSWRDRKA